MNINTNTNNNNTNTNTNNIIRIGISTISKVRQLFQGNFYCNFISILIFVL